jgi:SAM-dependent methyltransferase
LIGQESEAQDESGVASLYQDTAVAATYMRKRFSHSWSQLLHQSQVAAINRVIHQYQPATILELAPGPARIATDLQGIRHGSMIEYSEPMLALAKQRLAMAGLDAVWQILHYNAFDIQALHYQCDLLYTFRFLRHFETPERARLYHGIHASLKPGGLFMLDVVNRRVRQLLDAKMSNSSNDELKVYDVTYTPREFQREMETYGFSVISMIPVIRKFELQSWLSYAFDHRSPRFSKLIIQILEFLPSKNPLEWIALSRKKK